MIEQSRIALHDTASILSSTRRVSLLPAEYERLVISVRELNKLTWSSLSHSLYPSIECSSKHNRGVAEVFYEAARVSLSTRPKGSGGCVVM